VTLWSQLGLDWVSIGLNSVTLWSQMRPGELHDQVDDKWIVIRGQLRGHNDKPFGRPTPGRPIGGLVVGRPLGVIGFFSYY
jgi:hypothetical protein